MNLFLNRLANIFVMIFLFYMAYKKVKRVKITNKEKKYFSKVTSKQ